ncbi:MAG: hypothetical protein MUW57_15185 [Pseudomonas sp.]|nr:hypothetical protein [Pseudomonas sp.]
MTLSKANKHLDSDQPIICFGQQPNGFFPKRYLYAKINTAKELQKCIGGKIIFFYHDSDADYRETRTTLRNRKSGIATTFNFTYENNIQKKYAPFYAKRIASKWKQQIQLQLPTFVGNQMIEVLNDAAHDTDNAADCCLNIYNNMGLLNNIEVVRSGEYDFRMAATNLNQYFADIAYYGETVRAEKTTASLRLHKGGGQYIELSEPNPIEKWQISAGRDCRFFWMQSVIHATHYIMGEGERTYLIPTDFPDVTFIDRMPIDDQHLSLTDIYHGH